MIKAVQIEGVITEILDKRTHLQINFQPDTIAVGKISQVARELDMIHQGQKEAMELKKEEDEDIEPENPPGLYTKIRIMVADTVIVNPKRKKKITIRR